MTISSPVLQMALDTHNPHRALRIAEESVEGGVDWPEAGTSLIKSAGMDAVREPKKRFPGRKIMTGLEERDNRLRGEIGRGSTLSLVLDLREREENIQWEAAG